MNILIFSCFFLAGFGACILVSDAVSNWWKKKQSRRMAIKLWRIRQRLDRPIQMRGVPAVTISGTYYREEPLFTMLKKFGYDIEEHIGNLSVDEIAKDGASDREVSEFLHGHHL